MTAALVDYRSWDDDNGRWLGFPFREGDIVISTRSKSGTTWMQMICALLVFQTPDLPAPLVELSPWIDSLVRPLDDVLASLEAQRHRRFVKTHTPLDGVPVDSRATYIIVGREPVDMAVSLFHQGANLDRDRIAALTGNPKPAAEAQQSLHDWLVAWTTWRGTPQERLDSLPGVAWHAADAWTRRHEPNVVLVHYQDLCDDLDGAMRRLADRLHIEVPSKRWPALVDAAQFDAMRSRADELAPDMQGVLRDRRAFFRRGSSGAGRTVLDDAEHAAYEARLHELAPDDVVTWLHRQ